MDNWSFNESFIWRNYYPECSNNNQSPINIDTELIKYCKTLCKFETIYNPSKCYVNYNNNLIRIKYDSGSYLKYQDVLYELSEITIHTPSLHSIDGEKYDCEICMIHKLSDNSSDINGIILSRMFQRGPHDDGKPEQFINQIINEIPNLLIMIKKLKYLKSGEQICYYQKINHFLCMMDLCHFHHVMKNIKS